MARTALLALAVVLAACDSAAPVDPPAVRADAQYTVTLNATWSAATHPDAFPPNPHFSRLTGAAHAPDLHLWQLGATASDGVRGMAETGATSTLRAEVEALGASAAYVEGGGIGTSPGSASLTLDVSDAHPLATVVTMVAPSPDWFVGVDGLDLREGDGWTARRVVSLMVYDAGTDDGASYTSANATASVRVPIAAVAYAPLAGTVVGTLTFERVSP